MSTGSAGSTPKNIFHGKGYPKLEITKLDAARRQIDAALVLWFSEGEPIAVHTLVAAGHHVLHDIARAKGKKSPFFFNMDFIKPEFQKEYKKLVLEAENFFKHAEKDPDPNAKITLVREITEAYALDAIELFRGLAGRSTDIMMAFRCWFFLRYPGSAKGDGTPMLDEPIAVKLKSLSKTEFFEAYLQSLELSGGK